MTPAEKIAKAKIGRRRKGKDRETGPFHCRLKELREALGLSLRDVCDEVNLTSASLFQIEGGNDICLTNAIKLSRFFGKPIEEIWVMWAGRLKE